MADTLLFRGGTSASIDVSTIQSRELAIDTDTDQIVSGPSRKKTVMEQSNGDVEIGGGNIDLNANGSAEFKGAIVYQNTSAPENTTAFQVKDGTSSVFRVYANGETVIPNNAYFGGTTTIFASGTATFGGRVTTTDHIRSNRTGSTDPVFIGRLNSTETIRLVADGSAQFGGNVVSGSDPSSSVNNEGIVLQSRGTVTVNRPSGAIFQGYQTGTTGVTSVIEADGSATFAGSVTSTNLKVGTGSDTDGQVAASLYGAQGGTARGLEIKLGNVGSTTNALVTLGAKQASVGALAFAATGTEMMRVAASGVIIGGTLPASPNISLNANGSAEFTGDITCTDNSKGLILKSPDGTSFRLSVANDGTLSASSI